MVDIRDNLRMAIEDRGFIKKVIAKKMDVEPSKLSQILKKNRKLDADELFLACDALGMNPSELRNYKRTA